MSSLENIKMAKSRTPFFLLAAIGSLARVDAKSLWSSKPAATDDIIQQAYAIGNGRLGGMR